MARFRHLLVLGKLEADRRRSLSAIATASKLELANNETTDAALTWLERNDPALVAFDTTVPKAEKLCEKVRSRKTLSGVPLIALTADSGDIFVEKLYSMGADDVIPLERNVSLLARLKALPLGVPVDSTRTRGKAVVCDKDRARCDVFGRVLGNAGYDVKNALDDVALKYFTQQGDVTVVVASADVADPRAVIQHARKSGNDAVWIITAQRQRLEGLREELSDLPKVAVMGVYQPAESVLFASNEMQSGGDKALRSSARVLYGTTVSFRAAGDEDDELGFTYNVSAGGLFVRTLLVPSEEEVWLELRPPRQKRRVRLMGRIAWRRGFDLASAAAAPPGFGVRIVGGLGGDLDLFVDGYHTLIDTPRNSAPGIALPRSLPAVVSLAPPLGVRVQHGSSEAQPLEDADLRSEPPPPAQVVDSRNVEILVSSPHPPPRPAAAPADAAAAAPAAQPAWVFAATTEAPSPALQERQSLPQPLTEPSPGAPPDLPEPSVALPVAVSPRAVSPAQPEFVAPQAVQPAQKEAGVGRLIAYGVAAAVVVAVAVVAWERIRPLLSSPASAPTGAATVASAPPEPSVEGTASALVSAVVSAAAPSASVVPEASVAVPAQAQDDDADAKTLNWSQGYLIVESNADADVYATGFRVGKTNSRNASSCGLRYVRLGRGQPPAWISQGQTVDVKCRAVTRVRVEATE